MKIAKVTTESGHSWTTEINGTNEEIRAYFMGNLFPVGSFDETKPNEGYTLEKVASVEIS